MCEHLKGDKLCLNCKIDRALEKGEEIQEESKSIRELLRKFKIVRPNRTPSITRSPVEDLSGSSAGN